MRALTFSGGCRPGEVGGALHGRVPTIARHLVDRAEHAGRQPLGSAASTALRRHTRDPTAWSDRRTSRPQLYRAACLPCPDGSTSKVTPGISRSRRSAQFGIDVMFTLNGGHIWPFYEAARERDMRIVDTRHEQIGDVRGRGLRQAHPAPGSGGAHRRARCHQRCVGGDLGALQRVAAGRAGRSGTVGAMGRRIVAGVRPHARAGADHEALGDGRRCGDGRRTGARRGPARHRAASRAGVPRLPARRVRPVGRRRARRPGAATGATARSRRRRSSGPADRRRRASGVPGRQRRLLGRCVGRTAGCRRDARRSVLLQRTRARHAALPITPTPSCGRGPCSRSAPTWSW